MNLTRVNLLPISVKEIRKTNERVGLLKRICEVGLGVFVLLVMGCFGWFFLLNQQISAWKGRETEVTTQLRALSGQEVLYRRFLGVTSAVDQIIVGRRDFVGMLSEVYSLVPDGSFIGGLEFVEDGVLLAVTSRDVHEFSEVVARLNTVNSTNSSFENIVLTGVSRSLDGRYDFGVELKTKKNNGERS